MSSGKNWPDDLECKSDAETELNVRWFLIVLEIPGIYDIRSMMLLARILDRSLNIKNETEDIFIQWVNNYSKDRFQKLVFNLRNILAELVFSNYKSIDSKT